LSKKITIEIITSEIDEVSTIADLILDQIDGGFTSGHDHRTADNGSKESYTYSVVEYEEESTNKDQESSDKGKLYINHYSHCGQEWDANWSCQCNDRCPACNKEVEPSQSEEVFDLQRSRKVTSLCSQELTTLMRSCFDDLLGRC